MTEPTQTTRQLSPEEVQDLFGEDIDIGATVMGARREMASHYGLEAMDEELENLATIGKENGLGFEGMLRAVVKMIVASGGQSLAIDGTIGERDEIKLAARWAPYKADIEARAWAMTKPGPGSLNRHLIFHG